MKYMLKSTIIAYVITLVFFGVYGFMHVSGGNVDTSQATVLMDGVRDNFNISPLLLLPPLVVILSIALKVPAIPGITLGMITAAVMAPIFQTGVTLGDILDVARNGFVCESDIESLNDLLSTGGLMNMSSSILMTVIAMMFGGIMEGTGQLSVIIEAITKHIKGDAGLIGATEATCILSNIVMPEQYISILVPGRMFAPRVQKGRTSSEVPFECARVIGNRNLVPRAVEHLRHVHSGHSWSHHFGIRSVGGIQLPDACDMLRARVLRSYRNKDDSGRAGQS